MKSSYNLENLKDNILLMLLLWKQHFLAFKQRVKLNEEEYFISKIINCISVVRISHLGKNKYFHSKNSKYFIVSGRISFKVKLLTNWININNKILFAKFGNPGQPYSHLNLRISIYQMPFFISSNLQIDIKLFILSNRTDLYFLMKKNLLEHRFIYILPMVAFTLE